MKKFINKTRLTIIIFLCLLVIVSLVNVVINLTTAASAISDEEFKTYSNATVNEEFDNESIIVVMKKNVSEINKCYENNYFGTEAQNIEDLTYIEGSIDDKMYLNTEEFHQILKIDLLSNSKEEVVEAIHAVENIEGVLWAGPNYYDTPQSLPIAVTGSLYSDLWGLNGAYGIQAEKAWNYTIGSTNVKVGVMDTGISSHPDLVTNLVEGWDFYNDNSITNDDTVGHGTHVAGIIAASGKNSDGMIGVAPNVKLVPLQVLDDNKKLSLAAQTKAITWAINYNIDIINFSGGGTSNNEPRKNAIQNYKGLFVCSSGNGGDDEIGDDNDIVAHYPSEYSNNYAFSERVISVGAINSDGSISSFSNYGKNTVSIFAPGGNIYSTVPNDCIKMSGTSMAAPFVAGVAALLLSIDNTLTAAELKQIICDSAVKDSRLTGYCVTGGRLNAYNAICNITCTLTLVNDTNSTEVREVYYVDPITVSSVPSKEHYEFEGYYTGKNGTGTKYIGAKVVYDTNSYGFYALKPDGLGKRWTGTQTSLTLYANWTPLKTTYSYPVYKANGGGQIDTKGINIESGKATTLNAPEISGYTFSKWQLNGVDYANGATVNITLHRSFNTGEITIYQSKGGASTNTDGYLYAYYTENEKDSSCLAEGTMITLADGSQKAVELLTGSEQLLVWNLYTGSFDFAPILFIDFDEAQNYTVINLNFSDGTSVDVISEHAFWDINLNKYVTLSYDAEQYVGHWFNKQITNADGTVDWIAVQLSGVEIKTEYTSAWSPVTYGHLCYYVNGMLSMPGGIEGLYNIFEVDAETMKFDEAAFEADIATYGLFTYEEFCELYNTPELMFEACGGQYLKVAMGKGLLDSDSLAGMIERYSTFF